jgi:hypothetical protein
VSGIVIVISNLIVILLSTLGVLMGTLFNHELGYK